MGLNLRCQKYISFSYLLCPHLDGRQKLCLLPGLPEHMQHPITLLLLNRNADSWPTPLLF